MRWSVRCRPRGDTGAAHGEKVHCSHSSERGSRKVPPRGGAWGVFTRAGGDPRARPGGVPLVCSDVTESQSGEREMGNLWPGPASSHWCTRAPGRGVHSPFGGAEEAAGKEILKFAVQSHQVLLWSEHLCPLKFLWGGSGVRCDGVRRWAFGTCTGHKGEALKNGSAILIKDPRKLPSATRGCSEKPRPGGARSAAHAGSRSRAPGSQPWESRAGFPSTFHPPKLTLDTLPVRTTFVQEGVCMYCLSLRCWMGRSQP